ncbi:MAG: hypothetical protein KAG91_02335 [Mycoplasmataceae bacterium]|nr:hypothetical protein [Mycoplasmataceae bacterium]
MKKTNLKIKRKIVNDFLIEINNKLKSYKFDLKTMAHLSKRSIFRLLKLSYQADEIEFDKSKLKQTAIFFFEVSREKQTKKTVSRIFKQITSEDMELVVNKTASDFIAIIEQQQDLAVYPETSFNNISKKQYLLLGVLRI